MSDKGVTTGYKDILDRLYSDYYDHMTFSNVTSSYWRKYGLLTKVTKSNDRYFPSGVGFGTFTTRHSLQFFTNLLAKFLFKKYRVNNRIKAYGFQVAKKSKRQVDFDCVKQILSANLLYNSIILNKAKTIAVIGDGYGYMTCLLKMIFPESTIINVNLGRVLFFDVFLSGKYFPVKNIFY